MLPLSFGRAIGSTKASRFFFWGINGSTSADSLTFFKEKIEGTGYKWTTNTHLALIMALQTVLTEHTEGMAMST